MFGVPNNSSAMPASDCMHHWRPVPHQVNKLSGPYFSRICMMLSAIVRYASSQLILTQPGSSLPLGFVRFIGNLMRSGWYAAWIDA